MSNNYACLVLGVKFKESDVGTVKFKKSCIHYDKYISVPDIKFCPECGEYLN